jgi:hypothetical protein
MSNTGHVTGPTGTERRSERASERTGIAGALILVGCGILLITGWWWPGIMVVLGVAFAAERLVAGRAVDALVVLAIFLGIPLATWVIATVDVPWFWVIGLLLIGLGAVGAIRALGRTSR